MGLAVRSQGPATRRRSEHAARATRLAQLGPAPRTVPAATYGHGPPGMPPQPAGSVPPSRHLTCPRRARLRRFPRLRLPDVEYTYWFGESSSCRPVLAKPNNCEARACRTQLRLPLARPARMPLGGVLRTLHWPPRVIAVAAPHYQSCNGCGALIILAMRLSQTLWPCLFPSGDNAPAHTVIGPDGASQWPFPPQGTMPPIAAWSKW